MVWSDFEISQAFSVENFNNIGCVTNVSFWKLGSNFDISKQTPKKVHSTCSPKDVTKRIC